MIFLSVTFGKSNNMRVVRMADISKLEQQESFADEYSDRIAEWELFARNWAELVR